MHHAKTRHPVRSQEKDNSPFLQSMSRLGVSLLHNGKTTFKTISKSFPSLRFSTGKRAAKSAFILRHFKTVLVGFLFVYCSLFIFFIFGNTTSYQINFEHSESTNSFQEFAKNGSRGIPNEEKDVQMKRFKEITKYGADNSILETNPADWNHLQQSDLSLLRKLKPPCRKLPPNLIGRVEFRFNATPPSFEDVARNNPNLKMGGFYQPPDCAPASKLAIIIPHRAREMHLRALLWHLHPILQRQQLYYKVYVVHQAGNLGFNKAKLMNLGFLEVMKEDDYDCVVFHDVDLLQEDDRLLYRCSDTPKHLSVAIDKFGYRLPYITLFGGVTMISKKEFRDLNGYSNKYWGWGGEDDDMFNRILTRGYVIKRPPLHLARYKMSFHRRDRGNRVNLIRYEVLSGSTKRMHEDGLNNVKYTLVSKIQTPIYTNITADVGWAKVECKPQTSAWICKLSFWTCEYFALSLFCSHLRYISTDETVVEGTK